MTREERVTTLPGLPSGDYVRATAGAEDLGGMTALVRQALAAHGLARLLPMDEQRFLDLAARLGEVGLRTELVIDPVQEAAERRRRSAAEARPVVYAPTELAFHTDRPTVDVIGWYCIEQDAQDGAVQLIDTADLADHLSSAELAGLEQIELGYYHRDNQTVTDEPRQASLVEKGPRGHLLYYAPWQIAADLGGDAAQALARFEAYLESKRTTSLLRIRLEPGEALFIDNRRLLHARGNLSPASRRHIVRLYIACPPEDGAGAPRTSRP